MSPQSSGGRAMRPSTPSSSRSTPATASNIEPLVFHVLATTIPVPEPNYVDRTKGVFVLPTSLAGCGKRHFLCNRPRRINNLRGYF
jgi:hypothetical protein